MGDFADALENFAFLSKSENKHLGGVAPSKYRDRMPKNVEEVLRHALCPPSLFNDDYLEFSKERSTMLADVARRLIE